MDKRKAYYALKRNPKNVRFEDLCRTAEAFGFELKGGRGSHCVYTRDGIREVLNFQNVSGRAKPYQQVRQLLKTIEYNNLLEDEDVA
jgi:predicted RNA binding protein YcfA (HicA-like mRNA interferase family)